MFEKQSIEEFEPECMKGLDSTFPSDYELCSQCGFDHSYEPNEAYEAHTLGQQG